ncbi:MAG: 4a-hydroxytetrahydrobiopterin dehydratase [Patescibacteria group bacterium]|nr:4a-hydroxytetrahydrobiopterin dehydratase [Patescibacteria group bacterium]
MTDTTDLLKRNCAPILPWTVPIDRQHALSLAKLAGNWALSADSKKIQKKFEFENSSDVLYFVNGTGKIATEEKHFPEIKNEKFIVTLVLTTDQIGGLSQNDFILAAKINGLADSM